MAERVNAFSTVPITSGLSGPSRYEHPAASHATINPGRDARQAQQPTQQVIVIESPRQKNQFSGLYYEFIVIVGLIEIVAGLFSIALGIANPILCGFYGFIGYGIWGGTIYIISGSIAILAKRRKTTCLVVTHLTMSNVAAMIAAVQFCLGVIAASRDNQQATFDYRVCFYDEYSLPKQPVNDARGRVTVDALLAAVAIIQAIAAILDSAFTCKGLCCPPKFSANDATMRQGGNVHCVPGHVLCSAGDGQFSRGSRAVINGVITFQGQGQDGSWN